MNLLNASQIRFNGSDITLIKLDGAIVYEVKNEEPGETLPYMVEYTVDNTCTYALNHVEEGYCVGLPSGSYEAIEITLLDGTTTTDASTTCDKIAKVKLWYSETRASINWWGYWSTTPPSAMITSVTYYNTSNFTSMQNMHQMCRYLTSVDMSNCDTSNVTNMSRMFTSCSKLTSLDVSNFNTSKVTTMNGMFYYCQSLTTLDLSNFDTSKVTNMTDMFYGCSALVNFEAPKNISVAVSFSSCTNLTHDSLMSIINNLATVTSTQTLTLGTTNLAKLTDAEKAIATNKGWTVS